MPLAFFHVLDGSMRPVDPGYGVEAPPTGPDNSLPGGRPPRPTHPITLPPLPPSVSLPIVLPIGPDNSLPGGGHVSGTPEQPIYHPEAPDNTLPPEMIEVPPTPTQPIALPPGTVWPPLPPSVPEGKHLVLVAISGVGKRWVMIDTGTKPDQGLPKPPPATAEPRRG